ncbi:ribosomal-protein-alanine N-acetyltransferase [Ruminiclostridium sufflavum DSM 19573]|uniref:Ribosomal-protein-alanine N-acetyltransferase n=1 Tax=Ruminiclostridium sufflavum DSM 19573 TaxID=1121337 RepID=A0A318Y4R4_9FIRM|nr:GNAT family N-acetyltransferase [Ruminiclostridium sufflavum]PYG87031.1 ribosomal-protein-alanine N-acetyltransferase [Ruminiclostridium sufflavum DSM 19573]
MKHLGTKAIETERLILRRFNLSDASNMYINWASDEEVTRYLTWPAHMNAEETEMIIGLWIKDYESPKTYQWCIELKDSGEAIGSISAVNVKEDVDSVEIGYCIGREFWRRGITSEAFSAVIKFFFEEVQASRIEARHDSENPGSGRVMEKCGLVMEGIHRQGYRNNNGICDLVVYGLLKDEWRQRLLL